MWNKPNCITVFEHERLRIGDHEAFNEKALYALQVFHSKQEKPFFRLIHRGVQFNSYVGVLRVGKVTIEILPKADKQEANEDIWRKRLIGMLKTVGAFKIHAPSAATLQLRRHHILDLYFELFVTELEYLLRCGLTKQYRKVSGNRTALKGSLDFGRHLRENLVHKERFYVRHSIYDKDHLLHRVLYQALSLVSRLNTSAALQSRIGGLLLAFPEISNLRVTEQTFERIKLNRKTEHYGDALEIARLLLLNYHPDLSVGRQQVLALLFDMNLLWERFVYVSLRRHLPVGYTVKAQNSKPFWQARHNGRPRTLRPDIVLTKGGQNIVLDTKWKNINGDRVSVEDLRQMYVYHDYYDAQQVALVFPGEAPGVSGSYFDAERERTDRICRLLFLRVSEKEQSRQIAEVICNNLGL